ncbi:MAG: putative Ig domain-containing protein [Akkermansiaceae bacterium]|nr:putative Ig domain-containing protein [Akkermansiaceae bacterium]
MDNFDSATWSGGNGWSGDWTTAGAAKAGAIAELNGGSPTARITRTLAIPLTGATLSFDWDLDRIATNLSESGTVEVSTNGTTWHPVWSKDSRGTDVDGTANMSPSGNIPLNIPLNGSIAYVRFTLNATWSSDTFLIDNLTITGTPVLTATTAPQFNTEPISKAAATVAQAYTGQTLAGSATDPNSNPLTFTKLPGGPTWLSVAPNGALSGTPAPTDAGLNRWTVQVSSSGGTDTATLLIDVVAPGPNPPSGLSYSSPPVYTKGVAIANLSPSTSGGGVVRYTATPKLPSGLRLNSTTGLISGTPLAPTPATTYTITATNTDGSTTASVSFTVVSPYAAWAAQYGLVQNLEGDDDGDGNSNYFEFVAGLVPTNAGSVFKTTVSYLPGQPSQRAIVFSPIISGRNYSVKSSESLQPATWIPLSGAISSDAGNERTVVDTAANEARKFYVIEIKNP